MRNEIIEGFFSRESRNLAEACREMSERFLRGGRLLAFGRGPYATDAQHVSVEFVHPVIVGKRALPALDLSMAFQQWLDAILQPEDIVMGFGPPEGDAEVLAALRFGPLAQSDDLCAARRRRLLCVAARDSRIHSSTRRWSRFFITRSGRRCMCFLSTGSLGRTWGNRRFFIHFLENRSRQTSDLVEEVAASIQMKVHDDTQLRTRLAKEEAEQIGRHGPGHP